jgi:hypothetical protein
MRHGCPIAGEGSWRKFKRTALLALLIVLAGCSSSGGGSTSFSLGGSIHFTDHGSVIEITAPAPATSPLVVEAERRRTSIGGANAALYVLVHIDARKAEGPQGVAIQVPRVPTGALALRLSNGRVIPTVPEQVYLMQLLGAFQLQSPAAAQQLGGTFGDLGKTLPAAAPQGQVIDALYLAIGPADAGSAHNLPGVVPLQPNDRPVAVVWSNS